MQFQPLADEMVCGAGIFRHEACVATQQAIDRRISRFDQIDTDPVISEARLDAGCANVPRAPRSMNTRSTLRAFMYLAGSPVVSVEA